MIKLENVTKTFKTGESALIDINLEVTDGEFVFLVGPSGSGKTTLFRLLIRELLPTHGTIHINDLNINRLAKRNVPHLRRKIGVVFQDIKMLMDRTIYENIMLPLVIAGIEKKRADKRVCEVLSKVGILEHKDKFPVQLSGGELQRAAISRAIVLTPDIVIADEPTGNLDLTTSWEIVKILQDINKNGTTILMATHNTDIIKSLGKRIISLDLGKIIKDESNITKAEDHKLEHQSIHEKKQKKEIKP
jgi:cell division transport system ATP-binding protein